MAQLAVHLYTACPIHYETISYAKMEPFGGILLHATLTRLTMPAGLARIAIRNFASFVETTALPVPATATELRLRGHLIGDPSSGRALPEPQP
jgi:hypothetical protein